MGETVGGKSPEVSRVFSKDPLMNSEHFDTNLMGAADCGYMVSAKKPAKKWILRGLKLRGLSWNQMNTPYFIYEIDQRKKLNTLGDFENQTPTHIDATHAFSKILKNFQNRIPRKLTQNFYMLRIGMIYWFIFSFLK